MKRIQLFFFHKIPNYLFLVFSIISFLIYYFSFHILFLFLSLFFILILFFRYFLLRPISIKTPKERISIGKIIPRKNSNQIVLFLDKEYMNKVNKESNFSSCLWDSVWINTLEQEVGSFSVYTDLKKLLKDLKQYKILILGRTDKITIETIKKLNEYVKSGGLVLLNYPENSNIHNFSGIILIEKTKHLSSITIGKNKVSSFTRLLEVQLEKNTKVLLKNEDSPLIISKKNGKGQVITLLFDYGLFLISMQQGKPDEKFKLKNYKRAFYNLDTPNLVFDDSLLSNFIPTADVIERYIINLIEERIPLIRFWYFPPNFMSAIIMSHDEEAIGDKAINLAKKENITSSYFICSTSPISKTNIDKMKKMNLDLGIHWEKINRKFLLFNKKMSLETQIKNLKKKGMDKILSNRIHTLDWGKDYFLSFRILNANDIKIDSSYGPNPTIEELYGLSSKDMKGYLFGTGLPFLSLDRNGLPFQVYEIPFQFQENFGNLKLNDIKKILTESRKKYHQITTVLFHPPLLPKSETYWKYILSFSKLDDVWKTNFKEFYEWWIKRSSIKLSISDNKFMINSPTNFSLFLKKTPTLRINNKKIKGKKILIQNSNYYLFSLFKGKHTIIL